MAEQLLTDLLQGKIEIDIFKKWISGNNVEVIDSSLQRTEFVSYILKYLLEETNKFVPISSSNLNLKAKDMDTDQETPKNTDKEDSIGKSGTTPRSPFQIINRITPTKTPNKPFSRHFNQGNDARRNIFISPTNQDGRNLPHSAPARNRRRNNSERERLSPVGPSNNISSFSHTSSGHSTPCSKNSNSPRTFSPMSNSSPFSPTSSQYSDSFPDLGSRGHHRQPPSPCLADFIITKPSSQKSKKRIKPTQLAAETQADHKESGPTPFGAVNRTFVPMNSPLFSQKEIPDKQIFEEERNLLKQKRTEGHTQSTTPLKILSRSPVEEEKSVSSSTSKNSSLTSPMALQQSPVTPRPVNPDPSLVSCCDKLVVLATVYSYCLDVNLVPNIATEMHFIVFLLCANYVERSDIIKAKSESAQPKDAELGVVEKTCVDPLKALALEAVRTSVNNFGDVKTQGKDANTVNVLISVHDCVMFASTVLEKQCQLLHLVDKSVVHLLLDNQRLSSFVPHFTEKLTRILESKESKEEVVLPLKRNIASSSGPVLYQSETDNKDNFSSDIYFNLFKKQRDGFYSLLHEWKTNHTDVLWVSKKFNNKVQNILGICQDPINMMHLGRLFCGQLINSQA